MNDGKGQDVAIRTQQLMAGHNKIRWVDLQAEQLMAEQVVLDQESPIRTRQGDRPLNVLKNRPDEREVWTIPDALGIDHGLPPEWT